MNFAILKETVIGSMKRGTTYDRGQIKAIMRACNQDINENSLNWMFFSIIATHEIQRVGRNAYRLADEAGVNLAYVYSLSDEAQSICDAICGKYPKIAFSLFESRNLNEFINHQLNVNYIFVEVEKGFEETIFGMLEEIHGTRVFLKPNIDLFSSYFKERLIIVSKRISEAPRNKSNRYLDSIEKLLVDIIRNKYYVALLPKSEYPSIFEDIFATYSINKDTLFRYARRRSAYNEIKNRIAATTETSKEMRE